MAQSTPVKVYSFAEDICELCGFSFVQTIVDPDGFKIVNKKYTQKLKLTDKKTENVVKVLPDFIPSSSSKNGICLKCNRTIEKVIKLEEELLHIRGDLVTKRQNVVKTQINIPSPRRATVTKRMLRSPLIPPEKQQRTQLSTLIPIRLVQLQPFNQLAQQQFLQPIHQKQPEIETTKPPEIMPQPKQTEGLSQTKTKRSLQFTKEGLDLKDTDLTGEIKISIYYPSGKRTKFIKNENFRTVCRAIVETENVDTIINALITDHSDAVIKGASKIISKEASQICKRKSGSCLQGSSCNEIMEFSWNKLKNELVIRAPGILKIISAIVSDIPSSLTDNRLRHVLQSAVIAFHGRSREMSTLQYIVCMIQAHGGCTNRDIERLVKIGLSVHPSTLRSKLASWQENLDSAITELKEKWQNGESGPKYQLVGDNWDKNIVPSYRTTQQKTVSIHLFNVIAVEDRITPIIEIPPEIKSPDHMTTEDFIPSIQDQLLLRKELIFIIGNAVVANLPQLNMFSKIYPKHFPHKYSDVVGRRTNQYPLGLFDCNETKTQDVIRLLQDLSKKYVPYSDGEVSGEVFLGGDRLTDERVQSAQEAMANADNPFDRLEGFISKIEDWHRLMNFLEAICKLTFSTSSAQDRGTAYYYRNLLNARNVKHEVKNSYRAYKHLYYTIFDAICCIFFLKQFNLTSYEDPIPFPLKFAELKNVEKIEWVNSVIESVVDKWFFEKTTDIVQEVRDVLNDRDHLENYYVQNMYEGRFHCHFCLNTYAFVGTLKKHEAKEHNYNSPAVKKDKKKKKEQQDNLLDHLLLIFKLTALHKNLDTAVDMGDGFRSVRSAKYELPIFNKTGKVKYTIGCTHLITMTSGTMPADITERLVANRCINLQGGKNNNMALDEYVELLNRDSKVAATGCQTKDSILSKSKEFPHLINLIKHYDVISEMRTRKGFHHLPSYQKDVEKVAKDLIDIKAFNNSPGRTIKCEDLCMDRNPYKDSAKDLSTLIFRHRPRVPFRRLRDRHF